VNVPARVCHPHQRLAAGQAEQTPLGRLRQARGRATIGPDHERQHSDIEGGEPEGQTSGPRQPAGRPQLDGLVEGDLQACYRVVGLCGKALALQRIDIRLVDDEYRLIAHRDQGSLVETVGGRAGAGRLFNQPAEQIGGSCGAGRGGTGEHGRAELDDEAVRKCQRRRLLGADRGARGVGNRRRNRLAGA
jgi:hypothetical protein